MSGNNLRDLCDTIKWNNICIIGVPEEEERKGHKNVFKEIMAENFPSLGKKTKIQIQEAQQPSNQINTNIPILKCGIIKLSKVKYKERKLESFKGKATCYIQGDSYKSSVGIPAETLQDRRNRVIYSKGWKKNFQPRILYPSILSLKNEEKSKTFLN